MSMSERKLLQKMADEGAAGASIDANMAVAADVAAAVPAAAGLRLMGYVARESAAVAAAASADIVHGATAAGTLVSPIVLAADGIKEAWFGPNGIACPDGISIDHLGGTLDIVLFYDQ